MPLYDLSSVTGTGARVKGTAPTITTINLTGGQITFPAAQNPSAGGNVLDDYEEGGWAPVLNGFTVVGGTTLSGKYTKIGNRVFWNFQISAATSLASTAGSSFVSGFPFTPGVNSTGTLAAASGGAEATGSGLVNSTGFFTPTFGATASVVHGSGHYEV